MRTSAAGSRWRGAAVWRRACWRWCVSCRRWRISRIVMLPRRYGCGWIGNTLGLELADTGFHYSVLSEFRDRLAADRRAVCPLEMMLRSAGAAGLLRGGARARTDSTQVLARVRTLSRLERVGETVRAALNQL